MRRILRISALISFMVLVSCSNEYGELNARKVDYVLEAKQIGKSKDGKITYQIGNSGNPNEHYFDNYYVTEKMLGEEYTYEEKTSYLTEIDEYEVKVFDFDTRKAIKTIDVLKEAKKEIDLDKYQFTPSLMQSITNKDGHECIVVRLAEIPNNVKTDEDNEEYYDFYIGIFDDYTYFETHPSQIGFRSIYYKESIGLLRNDNFLAINVPRIAKGGLPIEIGYNPYWYQTEYDGICLINIDLAQLKAIENPKIRLYTEFPEIKEYIDSMTMEEEQNNDLNLQISDMDWREILSLFMEEGKEISFEGFILEGNQSIDGQDHEIHNEEEFYQYAKWPEHEGFFKDK